MSSGFATCDMMLVTLVTDLVAWLDEHVWHHLANLIASWAYMGTGMLAGRRAGGDSRELRSTIRLPSRTHRVTLHLPVTVFRYNIAPHCSYHWLQRAGLCQAGVIIPRAALIV